MGHARELSGPDLAAGIDLATLAEGRPLLGHAGGEAVILVRRGAQVHAVGATCTHYSGPLDEGLVVGETVRCPWHHACFDLRTGHALGPALEPIPCYEVVRRGTRVSVGGKRSHTPAPPPRSPESVVIVGAGAAGAAAAEQLRRLGYAGPIALLANESPGPVDRPNLSKDFLAGTAPMEWITLRDDGFYRKMNIELVRDAALAIDVREKFVSLESGRRLRYGNLLLAPGCEPSRLPIEGATLPHVRTLRTLADAQAIIEATTQARHIVVIGSSFIGLEVAASLRARNLDVDVVSRDHVPLAQVMGEQVGRFVQELHEQKGVRFHLAAELRAIHQREVELASGRLPADLVVLGVGVKPRTELAQRAGLAVDNGIVVDARQRASVPDVWAAGDVASYPDARFGARIRVEHWQAAERQGQAAARDMLGLGSQFKDVPFFWSQHYDATLAYVGHAGPGADVEVLGNLERRDATVTYRNAGKLAAVLTLGRDEQSLEFEAAFETDDASALDSLVAQARIAS